MKTQKDFPCTKLTAGSMNAPEMTVLNKRDIEKAMRMALVGSFAGFDENPDDPRSCLVGVFENLEASKWRGEWTERIRQIVRENTPSAQCVCIKPLPNGEIVWYSIDIA